MACMLTNIHKDLLLPAALSDEFGRRIFCTLRERSHVQVSSIALVSSNNLNLSGSNFSSGPLTNSIPELPLLADPAQPFRRARIGIPQPTRHRSGLELVLGFRIRRSIRPILVPAELVRSRAIMMNSCQIVLCISCYAKPTKKPTDKDPAE
jgi:hypothetical protein